MVCETSARPSAARISIVCASVSAIRGNKEAVVGYVLSRPGKSEQQAIDNGQCEAMRQWTVIRRGAEGDECSLHTAT